jgi:hypothetical protein
MFRAVQGHNQGGIYKGITSTADSVKEVCIHSFIHSFHWHVQNATILCRWQELLPFLCVIYPFLPPFSTS